MTTKEKIINRLNKGFGFSIPLDAPCTHHQKERYGGGTWSWSVKKGSVDVGSQYSMTECLKWNRWIYDQDMHEIFEYVPSDAKRLEKNPDILIEKQ